MPRSGSRRQLLHRLSRDRSSLIRSSLVILGISLLFALSTSSLRQAIEVELAPRSPLIPLELALTRDSATAESIARQLRNLHEFAPSSAGAHPLENPPLNLPQGLNLTTLEDFLAHSPIDPSQRLLFVAYVNARYADDDLRDEGQLYLETHARMAPPVRFASEFLGDIAYSSNKFDESITHYQAEATHFDSLHARERLNHIYLLTSNIDNLRSIEAEPDYAEVTTRSQRIKIAILLEKWASLFAEVIAYEIYTTTGSEFLLSGFAASIWFLIVIQIGHYSSRRLLLYLSGIIAGIASATLTLYVVILQENFGGMKQGGDWSEELLYFIVGVGLREELIKLALFAPLILFLRKGRDNVGAFLIASCVGLGFALQENMSYYAEHGDTAAVGRFISANFLHLAWTGILGHSLFRMVVSPKRHWEEFFATLIAVVVVHGLYDSLLSTPEFSDYSFLSFVIIFFVAQRYFQRAGMLRDAQPHAVAPLAVFLLGTTLLIGVVLNYVAWQVGLYDSLRIVGSATLSVCLLAFVFINEFKEQ